MISIIVPVYDVADYLERCIDSIMLQSFQDFEVLLVDDGSTDGSGKLCDDIAVADSRIRVFHKENGGVSSARNLGLEHASGEWVYFMDPDDELIFDGLSTLVNGISDAVDIVMGGYEEFTLKGDLIRPVNVPVEQTILDRAQSLRPLFAPYSETFGYVGHVWLRLYRMEVIKRHQIRFDTSISIREGTLFVATFLCKSRGTTCFISKPIYRYYHRESSAVMSLIKSFDRKYITSFDSNVKILHIIKDTFPFYSRIVRCAKNEVLDRYKKTKYMMSRFEMTDARLLKELKRKCGKELGLFFIVGYFFRSRIKLLTRQ